jgi:hypothetical protein
MGATKLAIYERAIIDGMGTKGRRLCCRRNTGRRALSLRAKFAVRSLLLRRSDDEERTSKRQGPL